MHAVLQKTAGQLDYRHDNGEITIVLIELASMGTRRVRIAHLPPELPDRAIREALSTYGDVKKSGMEHDPEHINIQTITCLKKHVPSHLSIAAIRALIS
jgi:hypothetical protein